ncbi:MAG: FAD-dependent oxidoreductase [Arhodomonas sp.]|nr:FAD-dependent oxidoreductase [Arhodomonas sp.]
MPPLEAARQGLRRRHHEPASAPSSSCPPSSPAACTAWSSPTALASRAGPWCSPPAPAGGELGVPGEAEYRNKGVAYCPHCDGPLFKGKRVAVIGGGNSGVEAAIDLAGIVDHVTVLEFADAAAAPTRCCRSKLRQPAQRRPSSAQRPDHRGHR